MILSVASLRGEPEGSTPHPVHLICGGGSGTHILHALIRHGYPVTTGVLNESDNDWETAVVLGVETAAEAPFSAISARARDEAAGLMARAETILLAEVRERACHARKPSAFAYAGRIFQTVSLAIAQADVTAT